MYKDKRKEAKKEKSREVEKQLVKLLWPVLVELKQKMDRRLVSTFLGLAHDDHHAPTSRPRFVERM